MTPQEWSSTDCCRLVCVAIDKMSVKRVGRAMATKVLHMKRPRLVPILDSLVVESAAATRGSANPPGDRSAAARAVSRPTRPDRGYVPIRYRTVQ